MNPQHDNLVRFHLFQQRMHEGRAQRNAGPKNWVILVCQLSKLPSFPTEDEKDKSQSKTMSL